MSLFTLLRRTYRLLPDAFRRRGAALCGLLVLQAVFELASLGAIVPAVRILAAPETLFGIDPSGSGSRGTLTALVLIGFLALFAVKNLFVHFVSRREASFVYDLYCDRSTNLYRHHLSSGLLALRKSTAAEITRDVIGGTNRFAGNVVLTFLLLFAELVMIALLSLGVALYEPLAFAAVAGTVLPLFVIFYLRVKRRIAKVEGRLNQLDALLSGVVFESLHGYADVVATGSEDFFLRRYANLVREYADSWRWRTIAGLVPQRLGEMAVIVGVVVLAVYSRFGLPDLASRMTLFGLYVVAAYRLLPSINRITICLLSIRGSAYSLDVLESAAASAAEAAHEEIRFEREIVFENVRFRYPDAADETLCGVGLRIRKGECLGIGGPSGEGKSTFLHLLLGLFEPTAGTIRIDDHPLAPKTVASWRRKTGYVAQELFLLDGTVGENIAFGVGPEYLDRERMNRAVDLAALKEVIDALPEGLGTKVAEHGARLSVGQKQRIAIARAIYHGAELVAFDEPTSALDPRLEREIAESIRRLTEAGCTVVLVSHREEPLRVCDRAVILENGRLETRKDAGDSLAGPPVPFLRA